MRSHHEISGCPRIPNICDSFTPPRRPVRRGFRASARGAMAFTTVGADAVSVAEPQLRGSGVRPKQKTQTGENLTAMASNLRAMASNPRAIFAPKNRTWDGMGKFGSPKNPSIQARLVQGTNSPTKNGIGKRHYRYYRPLYNYGRLRLKGWKPESWASTDLTRLALIIPVLSCSEHVGTGRPPTSPPPIRFS